MFETLDAALWDPTSEAAYFFAGDRFLEHRRGRPGPVQTLGVDRWPALPTDLRRDLDAAFWHPGERAVYFVRGARFAAYAGGAVRTGALGVDAFPWLPPAFRDGIDAAFYCSARECVCFFRGDRFVEADPWTGRCDGGVQPLAAWGLPFTRIDAAFETPDRRVYIFHGERYARWDPPGVVEPHYPVRTGRPYGRGLPTGRGGGWPGLARILAGPLVGGVGTTTAAIWVWTLDRATAGRLRLGAHVPVVRDLVGDDLRGAVDAVHRGSHIAALELADLAPDTAYELELLDGERVLDTVAFRTARLPADTGTVELVVGSCADTVEHRDAPVFMRMAERAGDVAILHGDNCYYVNASGSSSDSFFRGGWLRADWDAPARMLLRQLAARNHPHFDAFARAGSIRATWDDHDFGYNNSGGHDTQRWAGRDASAAIHRAMWPAPYVHRAGIYHAFRTGPVEVFITDNRYEKDAAARVMLGDEQLSWLLAGLAASDAPVVVIVLASQFLYRDKHESFQADAPAERAAIMDALGLSGGRGVVRGRVLLVTGDVHYSELLRAPVSAEPRVLELTSSSIRTGERDGSIHEWVPGSQVWAVQDDAFATIRIEVRGWAGETVDGTITIEARGNTGEVLQGDVGGPCRTVWNLRDGTYA